MVQAGQSDSFLVCTAASENHFLRVDVSLYAGLKEVNVRKIETRN
jgi:hypothetical protein